MQRYDTYKNSGVYFLPDLPANWEIRKAKYLFKEENRPVKPDDEIVTCFRDGQVTLRKNRRVEGFTNSLKEIGYQGVRKGDLVIHNMDAFAGSIGISDSDGKATPVYSCCTPKSSEVNQFYYCYLLRFLARNGFILSLAKGIRERSTDFRFNDFKELYLPVPSREEQDAIVKHIDTATAKIDAAIAQQQKMIEFLNERKQIIINRAVTKGLNPNAKMNDSGVEWIGEVPEGWEMRRLKRLLKANLMYGANESAESEDESYPRYIRITDIDEDGKLRPDTFRSLPPAKAEPYLLKKGDLLFARSGATAGKTYLFNEDIKACFAGYLIKASLKETLLPEYLNYYTKSGIYDNWKKSIFIQATIPNIGAEKYANLQITLPSIKEQKDIVKHLDVETGKINQVVRNCKNQISLLQERKQIIINEVVTGKVKVTN